MKLFFVSEVNSCSSEKFFQNLSNSIIFWYFFKEVEVWCCKFVGFCNFFMKTFNSSDNFGKISYPWYHPDRTK